MKSNRELTVSRAMAEAIAQEMRTDPSVFVMGEDIGTYGGIFGATAGLLDEFGEERVRDTPISETGFIGAAVGAAMAGMRPIAELMFVDFYGVCMDSISNLAAKNIYFSGGNCKVPMVLMTATGGGYNDAGQHSQALHATFAHLPGLKVVAPSNAYDAKGLMISAIRDDSPVIYMFHKGLQGLAWMNWPQSAAAIVPEDAYAIPFGEAKVLREGRDVTIVAISMMVHRAMEAAEALAADGIDAEVIDLRTLVPLDRKTVVESVRKTGRLVVVDEDYSSYGLTAEVIASVVETDISLLKAAPRRVAYPDIPIPYSRPMEDFALPNADKIGAAVRQTLGKAA
ncbi:alpha-ketoacid dehydrogenase subunit beta [Polymorphum gilvum]|uniref:TPP-dependent acetoin dehydrogenase complex, E1 component, beta subunit n=1 Tax=Polymorphum gilvum (strain LMG 25793 / CGMCC 1.9160 / SL003B-26A1) TaxID=991905 RepID=F2J2H4_POLGS|nr:alpha-ketoacid dehydrogenase subunit beta [Polymorphum gilvum]ADZ70889.1 TPP-dependent acetoin dehydrogenase complex, E1 component, beta subunit [Polymorphum gilvum SL003B-26A1]